MCPARGKSEVFLTKTAIDQDRLLGCFDHDCVERPAERIVREKSIVQPRVEALRVSVCTP